MSAKTLRVALTACAICVAAPAALAADDNPIEARKGFFQGIKMHMGPMVAVAKGQMDYSDDTRNHAAGMLAFANMTAAMFPAGSGEGDTGTKPEVWSDADGFAKAVAAFRDAAAKLAAADEFAFAPAVMALGKTCKGCHDDYREKH